MGSRFALLWACQHCAAKAMSPKKDETAVHCCYPALSVPLSCWCLERFFMLYQPCSLLFVCFTVETYSENSGCKGELVQNKTKRTEFFTADTHGKEYFQGIEKNDR